MKVLPVPGLPDKIKFVLLLINFFSVLDGIKLITSLLNNKS